MKQLEENLQQTEKSSPPKSQNFWGYDDDDDDDKKLHFPRTNRAWDIQLF